jgi:hypothetical protein
MCWDIREDKVFVNNVAERLRPATLFMRHSDTRFLAIPVNHRIAPLSAGAGVTCCGGYMGYPPSKLKVYLFSYLVL